MEQILLHVSPLSAAEFEPFGEVIEIAGHPPQWINNGTCERFDDLARIDVAEDGGRPLVSIFRARDQPLPIAVSSLERHPRSSQAFFPLEQLPFLIVVAHEGTVPLARNVRAFVSSGLQGINYRRNTWHHPLIALHRAAHFLVIDRGGPGENCEERALEGARVLVSG